VRPAFVGHWREAHDSGRVRPPVRRRYAPIAEPACVR
jgi:hypothetical protein